MRGTLGRLIPFAAVATAGVLNVFLMRGEELRRGIDVFAAKPVQDTQNTQNLQDSDKPSSLSSNSTSDSADADPTHTSLGRSRIAARTAVTQTALTRVFNSTPIMVLPPLILARLQQQEWLKSRPKLVLPVNLGLILTASAFALPLALAVFPQRTSVEVGRLEEEFQRKVGKGGRVEFNRGI